MGNAINNFSVVLLGHHKLSVCVLLASGHFETVRKLRKVFASMLSCLDALVLDLTVHKAIVCKWQCHV